MSMQTTVNVSDFAKKLRARLAVLQKERVAALKKWDKDFVKWQGDLSRWVKENATARCNNITKAEVKSNRRYGERPAFETQGFFHGAPPAPYFPSDDMMKKVRATLHLVGVTGQKTLRVDLDDVKKWFGDGSEEDDGEE